MGEQNRDSPRLAYLGPEGTYGCQAAHAFASALSVPPQLVACPTIPSVYSEDAEYLVMPLENTIHGRVTETVGCLLLGNRSESSSSTTSAGPSRHLVVADLDLPIRHCLVVRRGVQWDDIQWVRSHEQALGQSSVFLKERFPKAELQKRPSTAGAALSLLDSDDGLHGAAICSKAVVTLHPELEVLYEGTQGFDGNFTRFLLLHRGSVQAKFTVEPQTTRTSFYTAYNGSDLQSLATQAKGITAVLSLPLASDSSNSRARYPLGYLVELEKEADQRLSAGSYIGSTYYRIQVV